MWSLSNVQVNPLADPEPVPPRLTPRVQSTLAEPACQMIGAGAPSALNGLAEGTRVMDRFCLAAQTGSEGLRG
jgi:hypothetical protein